MARYRLEAGPIPLHHQVYLDLTSMLDASRTMKDARLRKHSQVSLPAFRLPGRGVF